MGVFLWSFLEDERLKSQVFWMRTVGSMWFENIIWRKQKGFWSFDDEKSKCQIQLSSMSWFWSVILNTRVKRFIWKLYHKILGNKNLILIKLLTLKLRYRYFPKYLDLIAFSSRSIPRKEASNEIPPLDKQNFWFYLQF